MDFGFGKKWRSQKRLREISLFTPPPKDSEKESPWGAGTLPPPPPKDSREAYRLDRERKRINHLLLLGIFLILGGTGFLAYRLLLPHLDRQRDLKAFRKALGESQYQEAYVIYKRVQSRATDLQIPPEDQEEARAQQAKMEIEVHGLCNEMIASLQSGKALTPKQMAFMADLGEVSASNLVPFLNQMTKEYLDNKIPFATWYSIMDSVKGLDNIALVVQHFLDKEEGMKVAHQRFTEMQEIEAKSDWETIWVHWQSIIDDPAISSFAKSYALDRLKAFQVKKYDELYQSAKTMVAQKNYFSAKNLVEKMLQAFQNQGELLPILDEAMAGLPKQMETYQGMIDSISVYPLCLNPKQGFVNPDVASFASNSLLTAKEFRDLLQDLYDHKYVLVQASLYAHYPTEKPEIVVPAGRKPLFLVFDAFSLSPLEQFAGTASYYDVDDQGQVMAYQDPQAWGEKGSIQCFPSLFSILDDFVEAHPDFSFDGAKATIALRGSSGILGYFCYPEQLAEVNKFREGRRFSHLEVADEVYSRNQEKVKALCAQLKKRGYLFASGSYAGLNLGTASLEEVKADTQKFQDLVIPLTGPMSNYQFPDGANCYDRPDLLQILLDHGFRFFSGIGAKTYNFKAESFIHVDKVPINGNTLSYPGNWQLERFCRGAALLDQENRVLVPQSAP